MKRYHTDDYAEIERLTRVPLLPETKAAISALTPADAQAALEAYGREKVREGMQRAAEVALCHSDDRPRRYSMDWNDGYIDGGKGASDAILADMETLK